MNFYDGQIREAVPIESTQWRRHRCIHRPDRITKESAATYDHEQFYVCEASQWQPIKDVSLQVALGRGVTHGDYDTPPPRGGGIPPPPTAREHRPDWEQQKHRLFVPSMDGRSTWSREAWGATISDLAVTLGHRHTAWEIHEYWKQCRVIAVKKVHRATIFGTGVRAVRAQTKCDMDNTCRPLLEEFTKAFKQDPASVAPVSDSASHESQLKTIGRMLQRFVLDTDKMPWRMERPAAPGGVDHASFDWDLNKTTLLSWDVDSTQWLGDMVSEEVQKSVVGATVLGCVGQPLYTCMGTRYMTPSGQPVAADSAEALAVPCGETARLTLAEDSFLELPPGASCWLCQDCINNKRQPQSGKPSRLIRIFPLVPSKAGNPIICVTRKPPCYLMVHASPPEWQFPRLNDWDEWQPVAHRDCIQSKFPRFSPDLIMQYGVPRFCYTDKGESDSVWNMAGRFNGRTPEAFKPGRRFDAQAA